ncbi:SgcJ/EcaC family oxidoreductase [Micromonospora sp. NPDC051196]|uniref:SgcJ/EcaC family oxidoreductase n=1 Tax=Micromonospora sp. NPDC051196 TaxID=3155281 RepID=UPI00342D18B0
MTATSTSPQLDQAGQAEIVGVTARMVAAWAAHDADKFAELFAEDGTLILPGVYCQGRAAIRDFMAKAYAGPYRGTTVTGKPIGLKPLGPGAVALLTEGGVIAAGADELAAKDAIRASWILVKRDGAWVLAVYQNCPRDRS